MTENKRPAGPKRGKREWTKQAPRERSREVDAPRLAAFDVLAAVSTQDSYANLVLPGLLSKRNIHGRDAGFATELTYGTLRMQGLYDAVLQKCSQRPLGEVDPPVRDILRLGAHQLLNMRIPPHAAVSQTVALARQKTGAGSAQFVNAVLRGVAERDLDSWLTELKTGKDLPDAATLHSHPLWMVRALREALLGHTGAAENLPDLLAAHNEPPKVTLVARPGLSQVQELMQQAKGSPGKWAGTAMVLEAHSPARLESVREGRAGVQDEGSQLVTLAFAEVSITGSDSRWLDMCAGPGGKAALLTALAAQRGAKVLANEVAPHRVELVRNSLQALPKQAIEDVVCGDGRDFGLNEPDAFDRILLDAPCTGIGALRRRPESRWRRTPQDLTVLTGLQLELLLSACDALRPGGVLGYVTCSPHLAETKVIVQDALKARPQMRQIDAAAALQAVALQDLGLPAGPSAQLWPHLHGTDAMHLALLVKD